VNIGIFGVGALGTLFAAHLAPHHKVTLVGHWPEQLAALRAGPLVLRPPDGGEKRVPVVAVTSAADLLARGLPELILVLVKSTQTAAVAASLQKLWPAMAAAPPLVITLQNGLGNREVLAAAVGGEHVALGVTVQGAAMVRPGVVRHGGVGATHFAREGLAAGDRRLEAAVGAFQTAGLECSVVANADSLVWGKVAVSAAINPLSALLGVENGALAEPPLRRWLERAAAEVAAVAAARGIALRYARRDGTSPGRDAAAQALAVCRATATNRSSMLQDVDRGRPTEIDAICGAVARAGRAVGISTPLNALYWQRLRTDRPATVAGDTLDAALATELDTLIKTHGNHRQHR
jgi:2-dehydropantoate 2-reductase